MALGDTFPEEGGRQMKPTAQSEYRELEQRYERLEKVANELYDFAWSTYWLKTSHELPEADGSILDRLADSELKSMRKKTR